MMCFMNIEPYATIFWSLVFGAIGIAVCYLLYLLKAPYALRKVFEVLLYCAAGFGVFSRAYVGDRAESREEEYKLAHTTYRKRLQEGAVGGLVGMFLFCFVWPPFLVLCIVLVPAWIALAFWTIASVPDDNQPLSHEKIRGNENFSNFQGS